MIICFFDFETTGIDPKTARPTELCYHIINVETEESFLIKNSLLYMPDYPELDQEVTNITGINSKQLKEHGVQTYYFLEMFLKDLVSKNVEALCAHNLNNYDYPLLLEELKRHGLDTKTPESLLRIDTMTDLPYPPSCESRKLKYLAADHGLLPMKAHSAMFDVATMESIFFKYKLSDILELAKSQTLTIRINTNFDTKEEAKKRKYQWNAEKKAWEKQIKECFLQREIEIGKPFAVTVTNPSNYIAKQQKDTERLPSTPKPTDLNGGMGTDLSV